MFKNRNFILFLVIFTSFATAVGAYHIYVYQNQSLFINVLNLVLAIVSLSLNFTLLFKWDLWKLAKVRLLVDHSFIALALFFQEMYVQIFYFYVIVLWIHSFTNIYMFDLNKKISKFLKIVPVMVLVYSIFVLSGTSTTTMYLFLFGTIFSLMVIYSIEKTTLKTAELHNNMTTIRKIQQSLVTHNLNNYACGLVYQLSKERPDLADSAIEIFQQLRDSIDSIVEPRKIKVRVYQLFNRMASYFSNKKDVNIDVNLSEMVYNLHEQPFLSSIYVFFSNSCEANAKNIKVYNNGKDIIIEDDGCGFDTTKLELGYTTKVNGHGVGLITSIESCKKDNIDVVIKSDIGKGTKIILKFNDLEKTDVNI